MSLESLGSAFVTAAVIGYAVYQCCGNNNTQSRTSAAAARGIAASHQNLDPNWLLTNRNLQQIQAVLQSLNPSVAVPLFNQLVDINDTTKPKWGYFRNTWRRNLQIAAQAPVVAATGGASAAVVPPSPTTYNPQSLLTQYNKTNQNLGQLAALLQSLDPSVAVPLFNQLVNINDATTPTKWGYFGNTWRGNLRIAAQAPVVAATGGASAAGSQLDPTESIASLHEKWGVVPFYQHSYNQNTAFMGNFHPVQVTYKGVTYKNAEAAYQAQKFAHDPSLNWLFIQFANLDGGQAWQLAKTNESLQDPNWKDVSYVVMRGIVELKFQDPILGAQLLATRDMPLVEHIPVKGRDKFFGDDCDGTGWNQLGEILMQRRNYLRDGHYGTANPKLPSNYQTYAHRIWQ